jgi:hypothetical protein
VTTYGAISTSYCHQDLTITTLPQTRLTTRLYKRSSKSNTIPNLSICRQLANWLHHRGQRRQTLNYANINSHSRITRLVFSSLVDTSINQPTMHGLHSSYACLNLKYISLSPVPVAPLPLLDSCPYFGFLSCTLLPFLSFLFPHRLVGSLNIHVQYLTRSSPIGIDGVVSFSLL